MIDKYLLWHEGIPAEGPAILLHLDYYQRVFALLHQQLRETDYNPERPHPVRKRFWSLLPYREYSPIESRELLVQYLDSVERELAQSIGKWSLAYWLHLYRRLAPSPIGAEKKPWTVGLTRAALEAAMQKYAKFQPCSRVGFTEEVSVDRVLGGILLAPEFEFERTLLKKANQLVLTDFSVAQLREFYNVERLAYEVWRGSAMLRAVGKGAPILVGDFTECVVDLRSTELAKLLDSFDGRLKYDNLAVSATGMMFAQNGLGRQRSEIVFLPTYNLGGITTEDLEPFFREAFNLTFAYSVQPNFVWILFNLREYREAHRPFAEAFESKFGTKLDAVLAVIGALCQRVLVTCAASGGHAWLRYLQRAYEGPYTRDSIFDEIRSYTNSASHLLNPSDKQMSRSDLMAAIRFWELDESKRSDIDLAYSGPHYVFLPYGKNRLFIDYAWLLRRLYDLFVGVSIPDQNFKGDALEEVVRYKQTVLPVRGCRSNEGGERQIDAAFEVGNRLVIVECRVFGRSIGFDRGSPEAIRYRARRIDSALNEVDQKAQWLASYPTGANYDIRPYSDILPIVVTPFVEFIPSLAPRYWLTEDLPRVLTPEELRDALEYGTLANVSANVVSVGTG